jgi:protein-S-isoprenylcysteine O-methyltransferase Ste14
MQTQSPEALVRPEVGARRLLIGVVQGALLYGMYRAAQDHTWPASVPMLFIPLLMVLVIAPVLLISSLGHMAGRRVAQWIGVSAAIVAVLGVYDAWRAVPGVGATEPRLAP